jgi:ATP-binding cassette subfamily A (ABC1) protein 2
MKMMGLNNSVHWLAWFLTAFSQMSIVMAILTVMLKFGHVLMYSNPWIIFIVLEVFAMATIAFS